MKKIWDEQWIVAHDQNKVFVERATARKLSPADAEAKYRLDPGKANAYVEFDIEDQLLQSQYNPSIKGHEFFIVGSVELTNRNPERFFNI